MKARKAERDKIEVMSIRHRPTMSAPLTEVVCQEPRSLLEESV